MSRVKLCGLSREVDISQANKLGADYIGFVIWPKSKRYVTPQRAAELKKLLNQNIKAVGVFVDEKPEVVANLLNDGTIDMAQLHGGENEDYIARLRTLTDRPIIKAFQVKSENDVPNIESCSADYVLIDSGMGSGEAFDWNIVSRVTRPYFLAGGLTLDNVISARKALDPYALDVSSGIETDNLKDKEKMAAFVYAARKEI